jgi:hypothetical protein
MKRSAMTSQAVQAGTASIIVKNIRASRAIQDRNGFPRMLKAPTLVVFVLTIWLAPWLPLAAKAGVVIPCGRRGGGYL